jgi:hypothetical protein
VSCSDQVRSRVAEFGREWNLSAGQHNRLVEIGQEESAPAAYERVSVPCAITTPSKAARISQIMAGSWCHGEGVGSALSMSGSQAMTLQSTSERPASAAIQSPMRVAKVWLGTRSRGLGIIPIVPPAYTTRTDFVGMSRLHGRYNTASIRICDPANVRYNCSLGCETNFFRTATNRFPCIWSEVIALTRIAASQCRRCAIFSACAYKWIQ